MSKPIIEVEHLSKCYRIGARRERYLSLRDELGKKAHRVSSVFSRAFRKGQGGPPSSETDFWALNDVSFSVQEGAAVGIIGRNGAGKSTLLKILSQITPPTKGQITMRGRMASLLEVGTGFHPELTGRENIFLNGAIMGMGREEIKRKFDEIVAFAEVDKFLDTPVKRYSSGMYMRLAFAVAAHLEPEILVVDEVLAVGDAEFQNKCLWKMGEVAETGRTVLFVSHNMVAIQNLCTTAILLESGGICGTGATVDVVARYLVPRDSGSNGYIGGRLDRLGDGRMICERIRMTDASGGDIFTIRSGAEFFIELHYRCTEAITGVQASIDIDTLDGMRITTLYSGFLNQSFSAQAPRGVLKCRVKGLPLRPDKYSLNIMLGDQIHQFDFVRRALDVDVLEEDIYHSGRIPQRAHGPVVTDYEWAAGT